ncbi:ATP-binding protein [Candidatus Poriferisodalis sp.]|uniref:ATP-binding protein n=1 Tax=Candidatus Poriferisodalis sp. TaxID=3101277 RepID=UPI003B5240E1
MSAPHAPRNRTLIPSGYRPRVADARVTECLDSMAAVLIEGPKGCGKTWTALRHARSSVRFDGDAAARRLATVSPEAVLRGEAPRLLDEWQLAPEIWNHVRHACDRSGEPGRFLLTGSAAPVDDIVRHSGAGRVARARLRPMSLLESGMSSGLVSLGGLLGGEPAPAGTSEAEFRDVLEALCVGGWPWLLDQSPEVAQRRLREYLDEVRRLDLDIGSGRRRDPVLVEKLLISLARNTATTAPNSRLAYDADNDRPLNHQTVRAYLDALTRLFIAEDLPAWPTHLRSRARLTKSPKRHFVDPSLAAAALRAGPDALTADLEACGLLFESLAVRDLRVYADAHECDLYHHRLDNGLEADAIIRRRYTGEWMAVEVKLSHTPDAVDAAARSLRRVAAAVDTSRAGPLAALLVITPTGYSYTRPDGVSVAPLTALGP